MFLTTKWRTGMCSITSEETTSFTIRASTPLVDSIRTDHLNLIRILRQWFWSRENRLELIVDVRQNFFFGEMFLFIVRHAVQSSRIDLADHAKMLRVDDELASFESMISKWIANITCN